MSSIAAAVSLLQTYCLNNLTKRSNNYHTTMQQQPIQHNDCVL